MTETLREDLGRARHFLDTHVSAPDNYETYLEEQIKTWRANVEAGERVRPFWARYNGDSYTQFAAHVGYVLPLNNELRQYAAIDISSDDGHAEVQVWLPMEDGSGEPEVRFREAYSIESLERAITFAEEAVQL